MPETVLACPGGMQLNRMRILLADDHNLFREALASIISTQPDMQVVGEASDGLEAIIKAGELKPDLILMDIQMPGCDGLEATQKIKRTLPDTVIVILTVRDEEDKLFEAIKQGAQGYLLKSIRSRELFEMLRGSMHGEAAISPMLAGRMLEEFRRMSQQSSHLVQEATGSFQDELTLLTPREQDVLSLVALGRSDKEIAAQLSISLSTVKSHLRNILAKLQVNSRREAARLAKNKGLL